MREATDLYRRAADQAWEALREKLDAVKARLGVEAVEVQNVRYDDDSAATSIDELPDGPKSSHPDHVEVTVTLEVSYRIVRHP